MFVTAVLSDENKTLTLTICGAFDFSLYDDFRASYSDIKYKPDKIIIDFRDTIYLDSSALGMLLKLKEHFKFSGKEINIINARHDVKIILEISRFENIFNIT